MNERDTSDIVKAMLGDMLGFDPFFDVTAEVSTRGPNADYAILVDGQIHCLLIVKGIHTEPHAAHLIRFSGINAPPYAEWVVLTNANSWACYRLGVGPDRHPHLAFRILLSDNHSIEEKTALFFLLSKEGMQQNALMHFWERNHALHPARIAALLLSEEALQLLRRELQRTASYRVDRQTLLEILMQEVLKPEVLVAHAASFALPTEPQCYAYVANINDSSTWKLPYRHPDRDSRPRASFARLHDPRRRHTRASNSRRRSFFGKGTLACSLSGDRHCPRGHSRFSASLTITEYFTLGCRIFPQKPVLTGLTNTARTATIEVIPVAA